MRGIKSFLIAGTSSGSGKTTVTLGLMAALQKEGHRVGPFKCGPDFIDPSLHRLVTGHISRNLDIWMTGEDFTRSTFHEHAQGFDINVIEGVMGMYDGGSSSSAALAKFLGIPAILVLDVRSAAESMAAVLKGFEILDPDVNLCGVILNNVASQRHLELVKNGIEEHCQAEILGYLPRSLNFNIPSRHLGLHMGEEDPIGAEAISNLAKTVSEHIDLKKIIDLAGNNSLKLSFLKPISEEPKVRLGVARDKAFCFYYEDNLDLLKRAGAELVFFSPLHDKALPENLSGIYLGGGYPELYGRELSNNRSMLAEILRWAEGGGTIYAECGGFMYLTKGVIDHNKELHEMVGLYPVKAHMQKKRASLGYREIRLKEESFFGKAGVVMRGHEFHYSFIDDMDHEVERIYEVNNGNLEGYHVKNVIGGYMHLHFGFSPGVAEAFVNFCKEKRNVSNHSKNTA